MKTSLILYAPVIHEGYRQMLQRHEETIDNIWVISDELLLTLAPLREICALSAVTAGLLITVLTSRPVRLLTLEAITGEEFQQQRIITIDDYVCRRLMLNYFPHQAVTYDSCFLRWDKHSVFRRASVAADRTATAGIDYQMMECASAEAKKTSDWWRQVGAVAVRDGAIVLAACNQHLPSQHTPYLNGDPRDYIEAGAHPELTSAIHAEQAVVAEAARQVLQGCSLYVTVFPCPICAKLITRSGISRLYYRGGHSSLDGQEVLKAEGVEIIHVP